MVRANLVFQLKQKVEKFMLAKRKTWDDFQIGIVTGFLNQKEQYVSWNYFWS